MIHTQYRMGERKTYLVKKCNSSSFSLLEESKYCDVGESTWQDEYEKGPAEPLNRAQIGCISENREQKVERGENAQEFKQDEGCSSCVFTILVPKRCQDVDRGRSC